jgi:hypothetical protein
VSFGLLAQGPAARAQPIDPYGAAPHVPPNIVAAPAPDPNAPPIDPYAPNPYNPAPYGQPPYPPLAPPPSLPVLDGGCPVGCPEYRAPAAPNLSYRPTAPEMERKPRYGLMAAGIAVLGSLWMISLSTGLLAERNELAIPIAGPILTAVDLGHDHTSWDGGRNMVIGVLVLDAVAQAGGLAMAIAGGASRKLVPKRQPYPHYPVTLQPYGAGLSGRF